MSRAAQPTYTRCSWPPNDEKAEDDLRFQTDPPRPQHRARRSLRLRLWLLFALLLGVMYAMQQLQKPEAAEQLGLALKLGSPAETPSTPAPRLPPIDVTPPANQSTPGAEGRGLVVPPDRLAGVVDHTFLRREEASAWEAVLRAAQAMSLDELADSTLGVIADAALIEQPEDYRGRVVTLRGTVLREEELRVEPEIEGLATYHRLVVAPKGGGRRPAMLYALELPEKFPRGEELRESIETHAVFFKSWSYRTAEGHLELAPLVVAPTVRWTPKPVAPRASPGRAGWTWIAVGIAACSAVAGAFVWYVYAATSRRQATRVVVDADAETRESLSRLQEGDA